MEIPILLFSFSLISFSIFVILFCNSSVVPSGFSFFSVNSVISISFLFFDFCSGSGFPFFSISSQASRASVMHDKLMAIVDIHMAVLLGCWIVAGLSFVQFDFVCVWFQIHI